VLFVSAPALVAQLKAHAEGRLEERLMHLAKPKLLIAVELGHLPFEPDAAHLFFRLVSRRYERGAVLIASNRSAGDGGRCSAIRWWRPRFRCLPGETPLSRHRECAGFRARARGKGCAERFIRTLKETLLWVRFFASVEELRQALLAFQETYNAKWLIERHGFRPPAAVREDQLSIAAFAA
jgi:hypothetical protein